MADMAMEKDNQGQADTVMAKENQGREDRAMVADVRMIGMVMVPKDRGKIREEYPVVMKGEDILELEAPAMKVVVVEEDVRVSVVREVAADISPVREIILLLPSCP
ncbi:hypothetical protein I3760_02G063100 [Carya illinoinensis]|uniref:Uncharacterized protein n=1 Tax=Carya illinoinensis TaxID=32201 RepID=A0A922FPG6_CARIL|nr:hypothetical protein I3760_02G063100 [Carya illinoinensis]KAG6726076.1 hypothetical protein I3842_02G062900 [Carya illinoinensis]